MFERNEILSYFNDVFYTDQTACTFCEIVLFSHQISKKRKKKYQAKFNFWLCEHFRSPTQI